MILNSYIIYKENIPLDTKPMIWLEFSIKVANAFVGELLQEQKNIARPPSTRVTVAGESKYLQKLPIKKESKLAYLHNTVHCAQICIQHLLLPLHCIFNPFHVALLLADLE